MNTKLLEQSVGQLVAERPSRSRVFERWGIDYCCAGKRRLEESCAALSIDPAAVVDELEAESAALTEEPVDWNTAPLSALIAHIVGTHHAYLHEALPRLSFLTTKVRDAHGRHHPELAEVAEVFAAFRGEMEEHAQKEEIILFPYIERMERAELHPAPGSGFLRAATGCMEREHEEAGSALESLRRLTVGYAVPAGACATYRAMLDALADLESDTHRHVHKENSILFPRALALEMEPIVGKTV